MTAITEKGYIPQAPPPPPPPPTTSGRVKWLREEIRKTSIRTACAETGVTRGDWQGIEAGHRGPRFIDNLLCIAEAWSNEDGRPISLDWLLVRGGGDEQPADAGLQYTPSYLAGYDTRARTVTPSKSAGALHNAAA